jgi:hypothetical protein
MSDPAEKYASMWRRKTIKQIEREIESWRRHFQKHNAGYGFTSAAIAAPGALADGDRMNILREILAERHGDEGEQR